MMKGGTVSKTFEQQDAARRYDAARGLPRETCILWMDTLRGLLPPEPVERVLDLGAGTGRFSQALQQAFGCPVTAVEPSEAMLEQGRNHSFENVLWQRGSAEDIPVETGSIDLVWMSQIFHHLEDPQAAFSEIHRVLAPGGSLAVRNGTRENNGEIAWIRFFPGAQEIEDRRMPSRQGIVDIVGRHGFECIAVQPVYQFFVPSYAEYADRIGQRGLSVLLMISDDAFAEGLKQLQQWAATQPADTPVYEPVDLSVFRRIAS
jgi:ubiquinone/menaquinone biosynthesis C-methylase UbiE